MRFYLFFVYFGLLVLAFVSCSQSPNSQNSVQTAEVRIVIDPTLTSQLTQRANLQLDNVRNLELQKSMHVISRDSQTIGFSTTETVIRVAPNTSSIRLKAELKRKGLILLHDGSIPAPPSTVNPKRTRLVNDSGYRLIKMPSRDTTISSVLIQNDVKKRLESLGWNGLVSFSSLDALKDMQSILKLRDDPDLKLLSSEPNWLGMLQAYPEHLDYDGSFIDSNQNPPLVRLGLSGSSGAWTLKYNNQPIDGRGIQVAIIDAGFDAYNYDIIDYDPFLGQYRYGRSVSQYDFTDNDWSVSGSPDCINGPAPYQCWHGMGAAEAAVGSLANHYGGAGSAPRADVFLFRVKACGLFCWWQIIDYYKAGQAMATAISWGADVVNMSFGFYSPIVVCGSDIFGCFLRNQSQLAVSNKMILFASAMNDGNTNVGAPAAFPEVLAVGALQTDGLTKASYSNYGSLIDIWTVGEGYSTPTPGHNCYNNAQCYFSNQPGTYWFNGTSAASPYAAGVAALIKQIRPDYSQADVLNLMLSTAQTAPLPDSYGIGQRILNAKAALIALGAN